MRRLSVAVAGLGLAVLGTAEGPTHTPGVAIVTFPHLVCGEPPLFPCATSAPHVTPTRTAIAQWTTVLGESNMLGHTSTNQDGMIHSNPQFDEHKRWAAPHTTPTRTAIAEWTTVAGESKLLGHTSIDKSGMIHSDEQFDEHKRSVPTLSVKATSLHLIVPSPPPTVGSLAPRNANPMISIKRAVVDFFTEDLPSLFKSKRNHFPCPCSIKEWKESWPLYDGCSWKMDCVDNRMPCPCDPKAPRSPRCDPDYPCLELRFPCPCEIDEGRDRFGYWIETRCDPLLDCRIYPDKCTREHPEFCKPSNKGWNVNMTAYPVGEDEVEVEEVIDEDGNVIVVEKDQKRDVVPRLPYTPTTLPPAPTPTEPFGSLPSDKKRGLILPFPLETVPVPRPTGPIEPGKTAVSSNPSPSVAAEIHDDTSDWLKYFDFVMPKCDFKPGYNEWWCYDDAVPDDGSPHLWNKRGEEDSVDMAENGDDASLVRRHGPVLPTNLVPKPPPQPYPKTQREKDQVKYRHNFWGGCRLRKQQIFEATGSDDFDIMHCLNDAELFFYQRTRDDICDDRRLRIIESETHDECKMRLVYELIAVRMYECSSEGELAAYGDCGVALDGKAFLPGEDKGDWKVGPPKKDLPDEDGIIRHEWWPD